MIDWLDIAVREPPTGSLTLSDCRAYLKLPANQPEREETNALIDILRAAVPVEYELRLNRALYRQRRQATALLRYHRLGAVTLEPHVVSSAVTGLRVASGPAPDDASLTDLDAARFVDTGTEVILDPVIEADRLLFLSFTYTAGWEQLPRPIWEAMLDEVQRRYERHGQRVADSGEVIVTTRAPSGKLPVAARAYRVSHDPVPLIPAG